MCSVTFWLNPSLAGLVSMGCDLYTGCSASGSLEGAGVREAGFPQGGKGPGTICSPQNRLLFLRTLECLSQTSFSPPEPQGVLPWLHRAPGGKALFCDLHQLLILKLVHPLLPEIQQK